MRVSLHNNEVHEKKKKKMTSLITHAFSSLSLRTSLSHIHNRQWFTEAHEGHIVLMYLLEKINIKI